MYDTIRITHVTLRFFMRLMSFVTFKSSILAEFKRERTTKNEKKRKKIINFRESIYYCIYYLDIFDTGD